MSRKVSVKHPTDALAASPLTATEASKDIGQTGSRFRGQAEGRGDAEAPLRL
jgi:hypothetical protein